MDRKRKIVIGSDIGIKIQNSADISETLAAAVGSAGLVLSEDNLKPEFFDLRTGLAGEFFQKFTNYKLRVAIIVPNLEVYGRRFQELAYEHASHNLIRILPSKVEAMAWLENN